MKLRAAVTRLLHTPARGFALRLLLAPLSMLAGCYRIAVIIRPLCYRLRVLPTRHLPCPVIAVGNITVGGTGKTPTVILLAQRLVAAGQRVAVITRGYGGRQTDTPCIVSDGSRVLATVADAGDEAVLLARQLPGIPVIACRSRYRAGLTACERFAASVVVMDDGFQHLQLARTLDIVLLNARDPFGNGHTLPRGILREPPRALTRAGIIVLSKTSGLAQESLQHISHTAARHAPQATLFNASYTVCRCRDVRTGNAVSLDQLRDRPLLALCGVGDPDSFFALLALHGATISRRYALPDHHHYRPEDYAQINRLAAETDAIVTTEKDLVKLEMNMLQEKTIISIDITQTIEHEDRFIAQVCRLAGLTHTRTEARPH